MSATEAQTMPPLIHMEMPRLQHEHTAEAPRAAVSLHCCASCSFAADNELELHSHMETHVTQPRFDCIVCQRTWDRYAAAVVHVWGWCGGGGRGERGQQG